MIYIDNVGNEHTYFVPATQMKGGPAGWREGWLPVNVDGRWVAWVKRVINGRSKRWQIRKSKTARVAPDLFHSIPDALRAHHWMVEGVCRVCGCWERGLKETCAEFGPCGWAEPDLCTVCHELLAAGNTDKDIRKANRSGGNIYALRGISGVAMSSLPSPTENRQLQTANGAERHP